MRLLLDSHVLLWWLDDQPLSVGAVSAIREPTNEVAVSVVCLWEISLKQSIGKLEIPSDLAGALEESSISIIPIEAHHALAVADLPLHHRDPFDRMLVAQAQADSWTVVTRDKAFDDYDVPVIRA